MSVIVQGSQIRQILLGSKVDKVAAALPATGNQTLFTVSGGRILLTSLLGEVTTVVQAQACATKITSAPTTGSAVDLNASVDITGHEVGGFLALVPAATATPFAAALAKQNAGGIALPFGNLVIPVGVIRLNTGATNTGAYKWTMTYVALDDGATVA